VRYGPQSRMPQFSVSDSGTLVFVPGPVALSRAGRQFVVVDDAGNVQKLDIPGGRYLEPRVSPDGKRVAFTVNEANENNESNIWVYELAGSTAARRLTVGRSNRSPVWSADGQRIAYQSDRESDAAVYWQRSDGSGAAERLTRPEKDVAHRPTSISPDGSHLLFDVKHGDEYSAQVLSLTDHQSAPFDVGPTIGPVNAVFSPDGRWVVYQTIAQNSSGVFVQPFPATGAKYQIATPGIHPLWSRDGKAILYTPLGRLESVRVTTNPSFGFTRAESRQRGGIIDPGPQLAAGYDTLPGGKVIGLTVAQESGDDQLDRRMNVIFHWADDLTQKSTR
jgi:eukaryotic-like serine/threonine-protein kinase